MTYIFQMLIHNKKNMKKIIVALTRAGANNGQAKSNASNCP